MLEFVNVTANITVVLGAPDQPISQFQCSVRASRVANFEWQFVSTSHSSSTRPTLQQITNEVGSLDTKYSVVSTDYTSVLTVQDVQFSDAGHYTCIASIGDRISPIMATAIHTVQGMEHKSMNKVCVETVPYTVSVAVYCLLFVCSASQFTTSCEK